MKQNNSCGVVVTPITLPLILVFLLMCPCVLGDEIFFMLAHCDNDNTLLEVYPIGHLHTIITSSCILTEFSISSTWAKSTRKKKNPQTKVVI